jgi:hypothetical protein
MVGERHPCALLTFAGRHGAGSIIAPAPAPKRFLAVGFQV